MTGGDSGREPVAVVGMALRFPPACDSAEALWQLLLEGQQTVGPVPRERWEPYLSDSPEMAWLLRHSVQYGSFLDDITGFDANFFGVSPREAQVMDPQQRIVLEVCWKALEHAGIPPHGLAGSDAGVFMGVADSDYGRRLLSDVAGVDALRVSGGMHYGVSNRVSYLYDLRGPSLSVDTACSSSLTALHLAVRSLLDGEIPLALAGGVHLMIGPAPLLGMTDAGTIAEDGLSKPFDAAANGYGRGEGAGVLVLKRLVDARRDGDRVLALIVGGTVNQDGRTPGFMAPSDTAQAHMLRTAYDRAGIALSTVDYVEAHGTGTVVGDPLEAAALAEVFGRERPADDPCPIGSVKANIGHLESASGVAGVIKTVLAMRAGAIPATPRFSEAPHPTIDWTACGLSVVRRTMPWPNRGHPRRAGVSSFGAGGTIGHLILEQAPEPIRPARPTRHMGAPRMPTVAVTDRAKPPPYVFPLSSMSRDGVRANARSLRTWLDSHPHVPLSSLAHTLTRHRSALLWRGAVIAGDHGQLADRLSLVERGEPGQGVVLRRMSHEDVDAVWVFSGQGSHWPSMGRRLLDSEPVFAGVVEDLTSVFREELGIDPAWALTEGPLDDSASVQALTFLMHTALSAVWEAHGVKPAAVVGHSMGEIAAAVAAGVLSRVDGARLACRRARLVRSARGRGAMALVGLPPDRVAEEVAGARHLSLAVHASPTSAVISGDRSVVDEWCERWENEGVFVKRVRTDIASHSPHMDPLLPGIAEAVETLAVHRPSVPLYSTVVDDPRSSVPRDGRYWQANLRGAVRFSQAVTAAAQDGYRAFLEISSHPIVTHSLVETLAVGRDLDEFTVAHSLRRDTGPEALLANLAELHCAGLRVDWSVPHYDGQLADLPGTVWQHSRYWTETSLRRGGHDPDEHTLLGPGTTIAGQGTRCVWQTTANSDRRPHPQEHRVHGVDIVPASVLINTFLNAAHQTGHPLALRDIALRAAFPVGTPREVQVTLGEGMFTLHSRPAATVPGHSATSWLAHTTARLDTLSSQPSKAREDHHCLSTVLDHTRLLDLLRPLGVEGFAFDWQVDDLRRGAQNVQARCRVPTPLINSGANWAPLLDAAMTIPAVLLLDDPAPRMATRVRRVNVWGSPPAEFAVHAQVNEDEGGIDIQVAAPGTTIVAAIHGLEFGALDGTRSLPDVRRVTLHVDWRPRPRPESSKRPQHMIVVTAGCPVPPRLQDVLTAAAVPHTVLDGPEGITDREFTDGARDTAVVVVPPLPGTADRVGETSGDGVWLLLRTARHLAGLPPGRQPRLWCLTEAATSAPTHQALAQTPLLGAGRAIAGEHPELWGGHIDIADPTDAATLLSVLGADNGEDTYLIRGRRVSVARLAPLPSRTPASPRPCQPDSTYLITGGLGSLGLETAHWLARRGARRLLLLGRTPLPPRRDWHADQPAPVKHRIDAIHRLEERGVTVHLAVADVSDREGTLRALAMAQQQLPPVRGIVHAAGITDDQLIGHIDESSLRRVLAPKVDGTLVLHELFPPGSVDFFVLFSSTGQLIRGTGQASYAAANAFLDGFAHHRHAQGDKGTLTLAWAGWRGLGLYSTATEIFGQEMAASGTGDISADTAFACWEHAEQQGVPYAAILPVIAKPTASPLRLLSGLTTAPVSSPPHAQGEPAGTEWKELPEERRRCHLELVVARHISEELRIPLGQIDHQRPLLDLGLDSRMALSIRARLEKTLGVGLPVTLLWQHPTVQEVVRYLQRVGRT
ncbi:type I polyketide synthase [Streptomyces sp. NPDC127068]|uniref:type I polyketide synthase n=1 Tax=Streptomyces sp. NPDC127068 TaxID=3347127 RepID=UPI0036490C13